MTPDRPIAAITGGTGFLGRWIVRALADAGWQPRLLIRRDPVHPQLAGLDLEIVPGDLEDREALWRLVDGASAVVHAAGAIKGRDRRAFFTANAEGTAHVAQATAVAAPRARLVYVSSLAAREPRLSGYAASKAAGERAVVESGLDDWVVVRPAAVYGPWDRETLAFFRAVAGGLVPLPADRRARVCLVHAADVASAVTALCGSGPTRRVFEVSDATREGYDWRTIGGEAVRALAGRARFLCLPASVFHAVAIGAAGAARITGRPAMVTPGKVSELLHPDWSSAPHRQPPPDVWRPVIGLDGGFAETVQWYRRNGWLPGGSDPRG